MIVKRIALAGGSGKLGSHMRETLLDRGYEVTILSRANSTSTSTIPSHPNQIFVKVDFEDFNSLISALHGIDGVVSNLASAAIKSQKTLIDAAATAGVRRFLPSDFGMDMDVEANKVVPFYQPKIEIARYLKETVEAHPGFSYTFMCNGLFLDWGLEAGVPADLKNHTATLWDGGETRVSATSRASVARAVAGVFENLEATENKKLHVQDTTITQKQIIEIASEIDGVAWTTTEKSTAEAYQAGLDELKKSRPDIRFAVFNQLYRTLFSFEHEPCFEDELDNDVVGLPLMTDEQVRNLVKAYMRVD